MLFLLFQIGPDRYALDVVRVAAVLPLVTLKRIPGAPSGVAGLLDYHGVPVPTLDLPAMLLGAPARRQLGTRLVLVRYPVEGAEKLLAVIVERATGTARFEPHDFVPGGVRNDGLPCLGPVAAGRDPSNPGLIQRIEIDQLLSAETRAILFREPAPAP